MDLHRIKKLISQKHTLSPEMWKGAVVFLCTEDEVIFIKRSDEMPTHRGQIAFIGGHKLASESDPWESAQREFNEETGLTKESIEFLGYLPPVVTSRMQAIVPVVACLKIPLSDFIAKSVSNGEWSELVPYQWEALCREKDWKFAWRNGYTRTPVLFHPMRPTNHLLWGATAGMVWELLQRYFFEE